MSDRSLAVLGAGTMGAGIAQIAIIHGWTVELMDQDEPTVRAAIEGIKKRLARLVEKGRLTPEESEIAADRLLPAFEPACFGACSLLIEAIVEDMDVKVEVLGQVISALPGDAIIASNTSSLSITELGERLGEPGRTVGMHFFNPAPLMILVEVISGMGTDLAVANRVAEIADSWGKKVARAADQPGFIVNHVARPYYLEAFRMVEDGVAPPDVIDGAMKRLGGFRMGPFELTDLIGQDINAATTESVWEQLDRPPLLAPSDVQKTLVAEGNLGRKTGRGVYAYGGETPELSLEIAVNQFDIEGALRAAVDEFCAGGVAESGDEIERYVFARILAALMVQAHQARRRGVATAEDIDTALQYGVNYPKGPFAWEREIGAEKCRKLCAALNAHTHSDRFSFPADALTTDIS